MLHVRVSPNCPTQGKTSCFQLEPSLPPAAPAPVQFARGRCNAANQNAAMIVEGATTANQNSEYRCNMKNTWTGTHPTLRRAASADRQVRSTHATHRIPRPDAWVSRSFTFRTVRSVSYRSSGRAPGPVTFDEILSGGFTGWRWRCRRICCRAAVAKTCSGALYLSSAFLSHG